MHYFISKASIDKLVEQAGTELGQAQLKLGLDFNFFVDLVSLNLV